MSSLPGGAAVGKQELFDSDETVRRSVRRLAKYVRASKHMVAFTGAGISTSAGIPDFRSGVNTKLATGAGAWVLREATAEERKANAARRVATTTTKATPTPTHMSLVKLYDGGQGKLKALVSQNTDGLHRRSGFPPAGLAELHGNSNLERCVECGFEVMRDFKTRNRLTAPTAKEHRTGRQCAVCGGDLHDTIINFGEELPERDLNMAFDHADRADLCLAMGSSLAVSPANHVPKTIGSKQGGKLVIVNLMKTPLDSCADLVIHAETDKVMQLLMQELALDVPTFKLERHIELGAELKTAAVDPAAAAASSADCQARLKVHVKGLSPSASGSEDLVPFQCIRRLVVTEVSSSSSSSLSSSTSSTATNGPADPEGVLGGWQAAAGTEYTTPKAKNAVPRPYAEVLNQREGTGQAANEGELELNLERPSADAEEHGLDETRVRVKLHFYGNYNEPPLELTVRPGEVRGYRLSLEPGGEWQVKVEGEPGADDGEETGGLGGGACGGLGCVPKASGRRSKGKGRRDAAASRGHKGAAVDGGEVS